jgi:hypothetical protein
MDNILLVGKDPIKMIFEDNNNNVRLLSNDNKYVKIENMCLDYEKLGYEIKTMFSRGIKRQFTEKQYNNFDHKNDDKRDEFYDRVYKRIMSFCDYLHDKIEKESQIDIDKLEDKWVTLFTSKSYKDLMKWK